MNSPGTRPRTVRARVTAAISSLAMVFGLVGTAAIVTVAAAPPAAAGTDTYPAQWAPPTPQDSVYDTWGEFNRECTSYAAWMLHSVNGFEMPFHDNASGWGSDASARGYAVNMTPALGSIYWTSSPQHVAWVESVNSNATVTIEDYNSDYTGHWGEHTVATDSASGYIHFKDLSSGSGGGGSTGLQGIQHIFAGDADGTVHETYWGGGNSLTTWQIASLGSPVTAISARTYNGVFHVYSATQAGTVYESYWGGGNTLTTWQIANIGSPVTSISTQITSDSVQHVYTGASNGTVHETYWGNGNALTTWQVASFATGVTAISTQVYSGVQHVYSGTSAGTLSESYWGGGNSLTTWQIASLGSAVNSVSSQITSDSVQHVYSGTADGFLHETYWGSGNSLTSWLPANLGSSVNVIQSMVT